jgi:hypothetical protein
MRLLPRAIRLAKASLPFQQVAKASQRLCSRHQWVLGKSSLPGSGFLPFGQPPFSWARWIVDCGPHQCAMQLGIDFALLSYMGMDQHLLYHFGGAELLFASYAYTCMYVHIIYVYTYCIHIYVYSYCIYIYTSYIYIICIYTCILSCDFYMVFKTKFSMRRTVDLCCWTLVRSRWFSSQWGWQSP